jgi:hypothetical protein
MLKAKDRVDLATAYWGSDATKLLKLNPRRRNVPAVCCLKGGK